MTEGRAAGRCFLAGEAVVSVSVGHSLIAHVSGIHRCGSIWVCPLCAPVVRRGRAEEIDRAASKVLASGGCGLLVTATGPHRKGDPLGRLFDLTARFGELTMRGAKAKLLRSRLQLIGSIRALEVTYGRPPFDNGWHPHAHMLYLFARPLSASEVAEFRSHLFGRWALALGQAGFPPLHPVRGVDVRPVFHAPALSDYLTKVEDGWSAGAEVARGDLKHRGLTPFELLADWAFGGDLVARGLWQEYEVATFGRRGIQWTPGMRKSLLPEIAEVTDEELALKEAEDELLLTFEFEGVQWDEWVRRSEVALVLRQVEEAAAVCLLLSGHLTGRRSEKVQVSHG